MEVVLHPHALDRLRERGVTVEEATATVLGGEHISAKYGRVGFRRNFSYGRLWRGKLYAMKQIEAYAIEEAGHWVVITVIARYF